jgi:hypothetical protein
MKSRVTLAAALLFFCSLSVRADDPKPAPGEMDPAMMEAMVKAMTPGDAHKLLDPMTGTFDTKISMWMVPGAEPLTTSGTSENRWVMGGRYVEQQFNGTFNGMPFEGRGYTGYDNVRKQYWGTWIDNMSTGVMICWGSSTDGKVWTFKGTMPDPMSGQELAIEEKVLIADADHHSMEMWMPGPDGKVYKSMQIDYTRKK